MKYNFENIYEHLGYLFFSVATPRGELSADSYLTLRSIISQHWLPAGADTTLDARLAMHIFKAIDTAVAEKVTRANALGYFKSFYHIHRMAFSASFRHKIIATINALAQVFKPNPQQLLVAIAFNDAAF